MTTSKSMHGFYNRTWNERSLSKYANEHNYENVYNNQQHCPNTYENVYFGGGCYAEAANSAESSCEGCVISQLTCSPRSARARLTQYAISPCSLLYYHLDLVLLINHMHSLVQCLAQFRMPVDIMPIYNMPFYTIAQLQACLFALLPKYRTALRITA